MIPPESGRQRQQQEAQNNNGIFVCLNVQISNHCIRTTIRQFEFQSPVLVPPLDFGLGALLVEAFADSSHHRGELTIRGDRGFRVK